METQLEMLEAQALKLTTSERAHLAERLIASLDEDVEIEEAWAVEVQRRIAQIESGRAKMIPSAEAIARARESLELTLGAIPRSYRALIWRLFSNVVSWRLPTQN
jgi:putative addiction module component (TIGR02574 family)